MSQHDFNIANQGGAAFRADLNNALAALVSQSSGNAEPTTTFAYMMWADTQNNLLKLRNAANNGWITVGSLSAANLGLATAASLGALAFLSTVGAAQIDDGSVGLAELATPVKAAMVEGNRLINGHMLVDQRNNGASITPTVTGTYTVDRWNVVLTQASKFSVQQNAGAVTPPAGFTKYLGVTSLSAYSVASGDTFGLRQIIEGLNVADLNWGTANAETVTLVFKVRSSLTGTHGGAILNNAANRSYPFSFTVNAANTWEEKSITIPGDTTGTWPTDNSGSMQLVFNLGTGATLSGTAGAWTGSGKYAPSGAVSVVGTNGATFYVTGVDFKKGTEKTGFEYRSYGAELALCQRYYWLVSVINFINSTTGTYNGTNVYFPVTMRTTPSVTVYSTATGASSKIRYDDGSSDVNAGLNIQPASCTVFANGVSTNSGSYMKFKFEAAAEL